jgi:adenosylcobinamide-GDP ribazoletransferase
MKRLRLAIGFLTIIPIRGEEEYHPGDLGKATGWFPVIGAILGIFVAAVNYGLSQLFSPILSSALSTGTWIALTGGLHLDGLADSCTGLFAESSQQPVLFVATATAGDEEMTARIARKPSISLDHSGSPT